MSGVAVSKDILLSFDLGDEKGRGCGEAHLGRVARRAVDPPQVQLEGHPLGSASVYRLPPLLPEFRLEGDGVSALLAPIAAPLAETFVAPLAAPMVAPFAAPLSGIMVIPVAVPVGALRRCLKRPRCPGILKPSRSTRSLGGRGSPGGPSGECRDDGLLLVRV